ncbi:hypothetical protein CGLAU_04725 [Corynebacterium glaucum]|uniref:DUF1707 domain-containing protein n=1 Tax=Corynebacterium glaucum TaxID=187491 RepID=A0A1Q2HVP6_9CORY|nr:DUF1707 domain-containing protein [Corynebacterium glaucum]AQQ14919.1 hypothetical protein CGLAU_04725 [Corynebacterium glaucum]
MSETPEIRIGHADRNAALDKLGTHFADGYLNLGEFEDRTARVADASTRSELDALFADLPQGPTSSTNLPATSAAGHSKQATPVDSAESELEEKLQSKKRVDAVTIALWLAGAGGVFLANRFIDVDLMWIMLPVAIVLAVVTYVLYDRAGLSWKEMEVLEEIQEEREKERAERLRIADKRRKELGN